MYTKENSTDEGKKERKGQGRTGCEIEWGREKSGNKLTSRKNISFFIFFTCLDQHFNPACRPLNRRGILLGGSGGPPWGHDPLIRNLFLF